MTIRVDIIILIHSGIGIRPQLREAPPRADLRFFKSIDLTAPQFFSSGSRLSVPRQTDGFS
jgi:hypothetical protein